MSDDELGDWIDWLRESSEIRNLLKGPYGGVRDLSSMPGQRDILLAKNPRSADEDEELWALNTVLNGDRPAARWEEIQSQADYYQEIAENYDEHFHQPFEPGVVRQQIALLDQATTRPLRLSGPIGVIRSLTNINFMIAQDGNPLNGRDPELLHGVPQQEPGYLSTELSAEILDGDGDVSYRMELVVRRGARGVYIGGDGNFSDQNELLLAGDKDYVVTGIERAVPPFCTPRCCCRRGPTTRPAARRARVQPRAVRRDRPYFLDAAVPLADIID